MTPLSALAAVAELLTRFETGDLRGMVLAETGRPEPATRYAEHPVLFARLMSADKRPQIAVQVVWFARSGENHAEFHVTYPYDRLASLARPKQPARTNAYA